MSRKKVILITGSSGEIGKNLINYFNQETSSTIISLDLNPISTSEKVKEHITGSILDKKLLEDINQNFKIDEIYHLAAMLSTKAQQNPILANDVNVNGTLNLINLSINQIICNKAPVKFFFPSSIAVYGLDSRLNNNPIKESEYLNPKTIYGMNKLYCEQLGSYFVKNYHKSSKDLIKGLFDFRAIRFPGLISVNTKPTGGTSDYIPEMLHCAAERKDYICFVRSDSKLPFMVMPDAINSITELMNVEKSELSQLIYNVSSFNPSVDTFFKKLKIYYEDFNISYEINHKRQEMVDGWPSDVDVSRSDYDWNWSPKYDFDKAFSEYFIPNLKKY